MISARRALLLLLLPGSILIPPTSGEGIALLVPAYFGPGATRWNALAAAAARVPLVAIANVYNGPGSDTAARSDYLAAIRSLRAAGGQVIGYVYTSYSQRPVQTVEADMFRWHQLYPLDGFFVDEMANAPASSFLSYYAELQSYARQLNPAYRVTGNPGTNTDEAYLKRPTADVLVIFENGSGYGNFVPSAWVKNYPAYQFAHLTYGIPNAAQMTNVINLALQRRAGFIYVTDDSGSNPWDTLPSYWDAEVSLLESLNRAAAEQIRAKLDIRQGNGPNLWLSADGAAGRYLLESASPLGDWKVLATNLTNTGTSVWNVLNLAPNRFFRLKQD